MIPPAESNVFDASNYPSFNETVRRDSAANRRDLIGGYESPLLIVPMLGLVTVVVWFFSDLAFWARVFATAAVIACMVAVIAVTIYLLKMPSVHPIRITTGGELVLGKRRWRLESLDEIVLSGHVLELRGKNGKKLGVIDDCQVGDLESFVNALRRQAQGVVFRADLKSLPPRQIRMPKM